MRQEQRQQPSQCDQAAEEWRKLRAAVHQVAQERGHYFGYPIIDENFELEVSEQFPLLALQGAKLGEGNRVPAEILKYSADADAIVVNWWERDGKLIVVCRDENGRASVGKLRARAPRWLLEVNTMVVSRNWDPEAEAKAIEKLMSFLSPLQQRDFLLTGGFIERSKRSRVLYHFRKCRPTIAFSSKDTVHPVPLCALCLHGVGYYRDTFGGAMVPSDDLIIHLLMMRNDEHLYWRQSNQHVIGSELSGT